MTSPGLPGAAFMCQVGVSDAEYDGWVARLDSIAGSPDWVVARERARLRPWVRTGADFEAFVHTQIAEFESMAREIGFDPLSRPR